MNPRDRWTAAAALGALALLAARVAFDAHLAVVAPEECLTGEIASAILGRAPRAPLDAYVPSLDEPGQLLVGAAATPLVAMLGPRALALKLTAGAISALRAFAALALLRRVVDERRAGADGRGRAFAWAGAVYLALELAHPPLYTFMTFQTLGTHNAGATTDLAILALAARRVTSPGRRVALALWGLAGVALAWKIGSVVAVAAALVAEVVARRREDASTRADASRLAAAAALGFAPRVAWSVAHHGADLGSLARDIDGARRPEDLGALAAEVWFALAQRSPARLALLAACLAVALGALASWRRRPVAGLVGLYVALVLGVVVVDPQGVFFCQYFLPPAALLAAAAFALDAQGAPRPARAAFALVVLLGLAAPRSPRVAAAEVAALAADERGACAWQLGQAIVRNDPLTLPQACLALGGDTAAACFSGTGFASGRPPLGRPDALRAWAFGAGRAAAHGEDRAAAVPLELSDARAAGLAWECATYADLICRMEGRVPASRVAGPPPLAGYAPAPPPTRCALLEVMGQEGCRAPRR